MISIEMARTLRDAGLRWRPASGDAFALTSSEAEGDVFTVSDMTIEPHEFPTGTVLGFNGTTEWALDSVAIEDALWLPREDQLRALLGGSFQSLRRLTGDGSDSRSAGQRFAVTAGVRDGVREFAAETVDEAYASALLTLIRAATE